jgi:hypothetical protein
VGVNVHFHLNKGQQAMAVAKIYPEPEKGGRGKKNPLLNEEFSRPLSLFTREGE